MANFATMLSYVQSLGADYNPSKANLKMDQLQIQLQVAQLSIQDVNIALASYTDIVSERENLYIELNQYTNKILSALKASEDSETFLEDVKSIVKKLKSKRVKALSEEKLASGQYNSVSQSSFDKKLENFKLLIEMVKKSNNYNPNEAHLQLDAIQVFLEKIFTANSNVVNKYVSLFQARMHRNKVLYKENGLYNTSSNVKNYLDSLLDSNNQLRKKVKKIRFTKR